MSAVFVPRHTAVSDFQHVGIIPVTWAGEPLEAVLGESDYRHAIEVVADVARCAPGIASSCSPPPRCFDAPVADTEHYGPADLSDGITKLGVLDLGIEALGIAPVDLDIVHTPSCVRLYVLPFVLVTAGPLLAGHATCVCVDAELQPLAVDVIRKSFDAGRKVHWVGDDRSVWSATHLPAVVNVHILIAGITHACSHHGVGCFTDQLFAHVAGEF